MTDTRRKTRTAHARLCSICRKPERTWRVGGIGFTNLAPRLGVCVDCINAGRMDQMLGLADAKLGIARRELR